MVTGIDLTLDCMSTLSFFLYMTAEIRPLYGTPDDVILFSPIISVEETKLLVPRL